MKRKAEEYPVVLVPEDESCISAYHPDLKGCVSQGETLAEALEMLDEARELWLKVHAEDDLPTPEPCTTRLSGRTSLRVPVSVHVQLKAYARNSNLSLNRLLNQILEDYVTLGRIGGDLDAVPDAPLGAADGFSGDHNLYPYIVEGGPTGGFIARNPDLIGCEASGMSREEAIHNVDLVRDDWVAERLNAGLPVPSAPELDESGYISLRIKPELHSHLAWLSERNEVSLNQVIGSILAGFVGFVSGVAAARTESPALETANLEQRLTADLKDLLLASRSFRKHDEERAREAVTRNHTDSHADFLFGVLLLERGESKRAMEYLTRAYRAGFRFEEDATTIYNAIPRPPATKTLRGKLTNLATDRSPESTAARPVSARFNAWLERLQGTGREEAYLRIEREFVAT